MDKWQVGQCVEFVDGLVLAGERAVVMADDEGEHVISGGGIVWVHLHFERDGQVIDRQGRSDVRFADRWEPADNLRVVEEE